MGILNHRFYRLPESSGRWPSHSPTRLSGYKLVVAPPAPSGSAGLILAPSGRSPFNRAASSNLHHNLAGHLSPSAPPEGVQLGHDGAGLRPQVDNLIGEKPVGNVAVQTGWRRSQRESVIFAWVPRSARPGPENGNGKYFTPSAPPQHRLGQRSSAVALNVFRYSFGGGADAVPLGF